MENLDTLARRAYKAYAQAVGHTSYQHKPLPDFNELGERQQNGWKAAVSVVCDDYEPETKEGQ